MSQSQPAQAQRGTIVTIAVWIAAAAFAPLFTRLILLGTEVRDAAWVDLRGVGSDLIVAMLVAPLLAWLSRRFLLAEGATLLWALMWHGNFEHIAALDANAALHYVRYLTDSTFLLGSALAPSSPFEFTGVVAGSLAATAIARCVRAPTLTGTAVVFTLALLLAFVDSRTSLASEIRSWRQSNALVENARWWMDAGGTTAGVARRDGGDLQGASILLGDERARNVLLIVLEGISGAYIEALAAAQGREVTFGLPSLDESARNALSYASFINHQRQTNRGLYAIICGDLPYLGTGDPRMSQYPAIGGPTCLPEVLASAGYATVFLQASPLGFMLKGRFMKRAGFGEVIGSASFGEAHARSAWGVDDATLFDGALAKLRELADRDESWFLTLLTVGTHQPYIVPAEHRAGGGRPKLEDAARYADLAWREFADRASEEGFLDDTLVIVTSDESAGARPGGGDLYRTLSQNWGFAIISGTSVPQGIRSTPVGQRDLAISILDYLRSPRAGEFSGRSLFRDYTTSRSVPFANTYRKLTGSVTRDGSVLVCDEDLAGCLLYRGPDGQWLGLPFNRVEPVPSASLGELARDVVASRRRLTDQSQRAFRLSESERIRLSDDALDASQFIFGGQNIWLRAGSQIEVLLDVELIGHGTATLFHDLLGHEQILFRRTLVDVRPGERLRIHYSYGSESELESVECRMIVRDASSADLSLLIHAAELKVDERARVEGRFRAGLRLIEHQPERSLTETHRRTDS